jgi:hypothetical protein
MAVLQIRDVSFRSLILIFIHPDFRIPDPARVTKEEGEKICSSFFEATNFTEL